MLFNLASNYISFSSEEILRCYKGLDKTKKGFRFLKSDTFGIFNVYLTNKAMIEP